MESTSELTTFSKKRFLLRLLFSRSNAHDVNANDPEITLYDPANGTELKSSPFYGPLAEEGLSAYIDNISARLLIAKVGNAELPVVITEGNYDDSYVCSQYGHYILLGLESLFLIKNRIIQKSANHFLKGLGQLLKKGEINNVIYINHSLFATDLHENNLTSQDIDALSKRLSAEYPRHAIVFRGVNSLSSNQLGHALLKSGYQFVAARQVQITNTRDARLYETRIIKSDIRHWKRHRYEMIEKSQLTKEDETAILSLYNSLAIDSHTKLNPRINQKYINLLKNRDSIHIKALKKDGRVEGVIGYERKGGAFTCLLIGYDKTQPDAPQLYRIMSTLLLLEAKKNGDIFHQSSGASFYKKIRRAQSITEFQAVYIAHLPLRQKACWHLLKAVMNTLAIPLMKRY